MASRIDPAQIPVIISFGQSIERETILRPLDLAQRAAEEAFDSAPGIRDQINEVVVVNILGRVGPSPAGELANRLNINTAKCYTTSVGGNTPQYLVNKTSQRIANGETLAVLIAGAEAMRSSREWKKLKESGEVSSGQPNLQNDFEPDEVIGVDKAGMSSAEASAGLLSPAHVYPLFESAIAHANGRSMVQQRKVAAELFAPFAAVASTNKYAWFKERASVDELFSAGPKNRMIAEPYTKRLCAFLGSDQGAAIIVTSLEIANKLNLSKQVVFPISGADATDAWFVSTRPDLSRSPAISAASSLTLSLANKTIDDVDFLELYSCFPSAVQLACREIGIDHNDSRGLTVTGGLPYFGGPGNNYTTHGIVSMASKIQESEGLGLVSALGWFATKHSYGLYGADPPEGGFVHGDLTEEQIKIDGAAVESVDSLDSIKGFEGEGRVIASSICYGPDGNVFMAPAIVEINGPKRIALAANPNDLSDLTGVNLAGEKVKIGGDPICWSRI
ncbi:MAG: hypothetical protein HKL80_10080 [Acidimicrobiales bacterium]|nr:hypothetical protein [Acidimicrobiales bacterium]